jgi:hypothetical protein
MKDLYPEHNWKTFLFHWIPPAFWLNKNNQRQYLEEVAKELKFSNLSDWYTVTPGQLQQYRLDNISEQYEGSIVSALQHLYPSYNWGASKFDYIPSPRKSARYWHDILHQKVFFDQLAVKLHIQRPEDWYGVSTKTVMEKGGTFLSQYNNSLVQGNYYQLLI